MASADHRGVSLRNVRRGSLLPAGPARSTPGRCHARHERTRVGQVRRTREWEKAPTRLRRLAPGDREVCPAQLRSLPIPVRTEAFFACWTRKEAYLKALGSGLAKPLDGFDVAFAPGEAAALFVPGDERETARWSIRELAPAPGYTGALVTEGGCGALRCWQWTDMGAGSGARAEMSTMEAV